MPFGPNCEYKTFADCVRRNSDKDDPSAYCGALERDTKEHCSEDNMKPRRPVTLPPRPTNLHTPDEPAKPWFRIDRPKNQIGDDTLAELYIYDEISWWGVTADDLVKELAALDVSRIDLHLNSPGGDAWDGVAIYNALLVHPAFVDVIVDGLAASAASLIAMAGDHIRMATGTSMMIHDAIGFCVGPAEDMQRTATMLNSLSDAIAGIYSERSGVAVEDWRAAMLAETWYSPQEAVDAKLADEVVSLRNKPDNKHDLSHFKYQGRAAAPTPPPFIVHTIPVEAVASPTHHTGTDDESSWSASTNEGRLPSPMPVATAKRMYAMYDAGAVENGEIDKSACHLPHHNVSEGGSVGAANIAGVNNALARVNQVHGEGKDGAKSHLQAHQNDAGGGDDDDSDADDSFELDTAAMAELNAGFASATDTEFERMYDPEVVRAAIVERASNAPATPATTSNPDEVESPVTLETAKALGEELWRALQ